MAAILVPIVLGAAGYFGYKEYEKTHGATAPKIVNNPSNAFAQKPIAQPGGKRKTHKKSRRHRK